MLFDFRWSDCAARQVRSAVREALRAAARPGLISLAGGLPASEALPVEEMRDAVCAVLAESGPAALQYSETEGIPALRDWLAVHHSRPGSLLTRDNILVTTGSQQGLYLAGRALLDTGSVAVVENPSYLAALGAFRLSGAHFAAVAGDAGGLRLDALQAALAGGSRLLYVIPNFQNPQGATLAADRRAPAVALAADAGVAVIEDDPYGELWFDAPPPPPLFDVAGCGGNVIRLGTFSKTVAPGLRVGWVVAPAPVIDRLATLKQAADLHTGSMDQLVVLRLIENGLLERRLPFLRALYGRRRDALLDALGRRLGSVATWTRPGGGFFLFLRLAAGVDAAACLPEAIERGVAFVPGGPFHLEGGANTLRLSFSHPDPAALDEGVARLAPVLQKAAETARQG